MLPKCFLLSKCRMALQYACECDFINACKQNMAFPLQVFRKLSKAQQHYVHLYQTVDVESRVINALYC